MVPRKEPVKPQECVGKRLRLPRTDRRKIKIKREHPDEVSEQIQLVLRNFTQLYATLAERTNTTHTNTLSLLCNNLLEKVITQPATE